MRLVGSEMCIRDSAGLGVARISHGHGPWAAAMEWLEGQARAVLG
jgi:hypothetical protein